MTQTTKPNIWKSLWAMTKYNFLSSLRNPSSLFFSFLFPLIFIAIFGLLSGGDRSYTIAIRPDSAEESVLFEVLKDVDVIKLETELTNKEINEKLNKGEIPAAIKIENKGRPGQQTINLNLAAAVPAESSTVKTILDGVINGINNPPGSEAQRTLLVETKQVAGREFSQIDFILPGQLAFALLSSGVFGVAFTFLTMRKTLVIKRIFATPTPKWVIILSEALSKLIISVLQAVVILAVGVIAFDFTLANGGETFLNMLILSAIGLLVFLSMGLLASSFAESEDALGPVANLMTLPQFLLSGAFFPIEVLPDFLQPVAQIMPMRFLVDAMRTVSFEGATVLDVLPELFGLLVWAIALYAVATWVFKWSD